MDQTAEHEVGTYSARAALDGLADQVCVLDRDGLIRLVNRAWAERVAESRHGVQLEVGNQYLRALEQARLAGDPDAGAELEGVRGVLEGRRVEFALESCTFSDPLKERWYHLGVTPLLEGGRVTGAVLCRREVTERRRAEKNLTTLYKAMDLSIDGLALLDTEGTFLYLNAAYAHLHGCDAPVELAARSWRELYPEDQFLRIQSEVMPVLGQLGYWTGELVGSGIDGRRYHQAASLALVDQGRVIVCSVRDITLEKAAAEALREREELMRLLVEGAGDFFYYVHDRDYRFTYISPSFEEITGYSPDYMMGSHDPISTLRSPVASIMEWSRRAMEEGVTPPPYLYEVRHRDGRPLLLEIHERPMVRQGVVVGMQGIGHNVTQRIRMEQELRESEERFRHIIEHAPDFIFYVQDGEGRYLYISPSVEAITGHPAEYYMMPHALTTTDNPGNEESEMMNRRVFEEGITPPPCRYEIFHADGRRMVLEAFERPVVRDGKVVQVIGLCRDVTHRHGVGPSPAASPEPVAPSGARGGEP